MHTPYSDGAGYHEEIAQAALQAGLDFVIVTDHNVRVEGVEGYYTSPDEKHRVLLIIGEEIHDTRRDPQANHMLVYGANREMAAYAANPQGLINEIKEGRGACYLAHPIEIASPAFHEDAYPWVDWDIEGFTGLEIWNYMSEFKSHLDSRAKGLQVALNPDQYIQGPFPEALALWDRYLAKGERIKIIGNSDAHAVSYSMGPISRVIFPYEYLFRCINTHIVTSQPFTGDVEQDKQIVLAALRDGTAFVGYDLPTPTRGFTFLAQGHRSNAMMGETLRIGHGVTLQFGVPAPRLLDLKLIRDGEVIMQESEGMQWTYIASKPGAYRIEAYIHYKGKLRGWIFSNPIFLIE